MNTQQKTGGVAGEKFQQEMHRPGELLSCLQEAPCEYRTTEQSGFSSTGQSVSALTDENLFQLCQKLGERARLWRQKFAGLLPEVYKRRLYGKKGFGSIFEFAKKLAGMSEEQVRRVLNLEKKFEAMPILRNMLVNGDVSINKLAKVASIATSENQELLADQVKLLPCRALETLVRDVHVNTNPQQNLQNATAGFSPEFSHELNLSPQVGQKLLELQQKGIDINALLLEFLAKRELEIAQEKEKLSAMAKPTKSRYIPAEIRKFLKKEYGEKCSIEHCHRAAQVIHHAQRFSLAKKHNPKYLAPLCEEHHKIAHSIDAKFHETHGRRGINQAAAFIGHREDVTLGRGYPRTAE